MMNLSYLLMKEEIIFLLCICCGNYLLFYLRFILEKILSRFLQNGSDLFLPGVVAPEEGLGDFLEYEMRTITILGQFKPIAVGNTCISSTEIKENGMQGKGLVIEHFYTDFLWKYGSKTHPPQTENLSITIEPKENQKSTENNLIPENNSNSSPSIKTENNEVPILIENPPLSITEENKDILISIENNGHQSINNNENNNESNNTNNNEIEIEKKTRKRRKIARGKR